MSVPRRTRGGGVPALVFLIVAMLVVAMPAASATVVGDEVAYDSFPVTLPGNYPSLGFQATQTDQFGDHVSFAAGTSRHLKTISVGMSSWACESGEWNLFTCSTTPGATFSHPITLNVFAVDDSGANPAVGALLASKTTTFDMPYRPSADDVNCTAANAGKWYHEASATCMNGLAFEITFDFSLADVVLPDEVILGVAYNTQTWGESPTGVAGPYTALNVGLGGVEPANVGTNPDADDVFWDTHTASNYTDGGAGGVNVFRRDTAWTGYPLVLEVITADPAYPTCVVDATGAGDYKSLKTAIDDGQCSLIEVRDGTYTEGPQIAIGRDLTIVGESRAATIIKPSANTGTSGNARGWFLITSGDVDISNMTFDGTGFNVFEAFRHFGSGTFDNVAFANILHPGYAGLAVAARGLGPVNIYNSTFNNIGRISAFYRSDLGSSTGSVSGNTFTGKGTGDHLDYAIEAGGGAHIVVAGNSVSGNRGVAASDGSTSAAVLVTTYYGSGTTADIHSNTFTDNTVGVAIGYDSADTSAATMADNTISNNDVGIQLTADGAATASSAHRNTITGNTTGVEALTAGPFDAACNWWGDASGPGGSGPGTGDPVTTGVTVSPFLTTSALDGTCGAGPVFAGAPADMEVEAPDAGGVVVNYTAPTASDVPDGAVAVTCDPISGSLFPIGVNTVTCTASDSDGNVSTDTFTVTVTIVAGPGAPETVGLVNRSTGQWHLRNGAGDVTTFYYGNPGDYPFMGDWDCNGVDTPGLYRQSDGYVYLRNTNTQGVANLRYFIGNPGDIPIAGDFDNDGCDTVSLYRPSEGRVYIFNSLGANDSGLGVADLAYYFGNPGDLPFVGDFDNDGTDTIGLHRQSTGIVYFRNSHTAGVADNQFFFGDPGDRMFAGDWNSDGTDSPGLYRPGNTTFYFRYTNTQGVADAQFVWGSAGWHPVAGEFGLDPV